MAVTDTLSGSVTDAQLTQLGAIEVEGGSDFVAVMTGTGDVDLYVRFGSAPTVDAYDCRPFGDDANETCTLTAPADSAVAHLAVFGYATSSYQLDLAYFLPCCEDASECNDQNPCTDDACSREICVHASNTAACDDADACTDNDTCRDGACSGTARDCGEGEECVDGECQSVQNLTLYTSCVEDDLNASDRGVMVEAMTAIGYTEAGSNTNISAQALAEVLGRIDINVFYHTGHGFEGGIATAGGVLTTSGLDTINVKTAIFATCLTLTETTWKNEMSASCENVLGYTNYSYDGPDDDVARDFADGLSDQESHVRAWYSANVVQSLLNDRWCGYTRESGGIVEYSARSSQVPAAQYAGPVESLDDNLRVATSLLEDGRDFADELSALATRSYVAEGDAEHAVVFSRETGGLVAKASISREKALELASIWLGPELPMDASLRGAFGVEARVDDAEPTVAAHRIRYQRMLDGMLVLTNGREHHLEVMVDGSGISATSRLWPVLEERPTQSPPELLGVERALAMALDEIRSLLKEPVTLVGVTPCYGSWDHGPIVPAYAFLDTSGGRVVVDATTGRLVY